MSSTVIKRGEVLHVGDEYYKVVSECRASGRVVGTTVQWGKISANYIGLLALCDKSGVMTVGKSLVRCLVDQSKRITIGTATSASASTPTPGLPRVEQEDKDALSELEPLAYAALPPTPPIPVSATTVDERKQKALQQLSLFQRAHVQQSVPTLTRQRDTLRAMNADKASFLKFIESSKQPKQMLSWFYILCKDHEEERKARMSEIDRLKVQLNLC